MRKISRVLGLLMLAGAAAFLMFALGHPEMSFPWSNSVTYALYALYGIVAALLLAAPFKTK